ncbi:MAG: thiamine ABC transporter substrate-binding protein [Anaerolineae bacterium]
MKRLWILSVLILAVLVRCAPATTEPTTAPTSTSVAEPTPKAPRELRVMTYGSFAISDEVVAEFEDANNARLQFLDAGDTGQMVSQAILSKDNPQADVMYGIDNTFLSRALEAGIFASYEAENLDQIPDQYELDDQHRVSPVDYGDVCLNYDKAYFADNDIPVPETLETLTDPVYSGLLVVENPASSSPGLAFLLTTISTLGEDDHLDFWRGLVENELLVVDGWSTAYYSEFSGGVNSEGARPIVVSYATSPAAEVYFSEEPLEESPTGAVVAPGTCFRQIEFVGILEGAENRDLAEAFVEFALSDTFQADIPLNMWVYPTNEAVELPEVFREFAIEAEEPATMAVDAIEQNREAWIEAWSDVVLR